MKMPVYKSGRASRRQGSAVLVVLVLLALVMIYALGNARALGALKRQLRIVEMRQTNSWPRRVVVTPAQPAPAPAAPVGAASPGHE